ncbi:RDD family protein [uncultured Zobellia sp.]|uniref:RDD family protein n=1 Tax=uncultured Zobellia sp. TaxID=255433 RepID=UPI002599E750|nr:RDD family protein [uncultured Zobellia sp.]
MEKAIGLSQLKAGIKTISIEWRFFHYVIDVVIIEVILYIITLIFTPQFNLLILIFPLYYILFEYFLQRTPGKYISGTIVIDEYGNKPDIGKIVLRTIIRYIPIEPFSCLGDNSRGWHDTWSKTYVIKKSYLSKINERLERFESKN